MIQINERINSPNFSGRGRHKPVLIVYHIADGTYAGTKSWFMRPASQVSSHYIIGIDGTICQCVDLENAAWCNGTVTSLKDARYYGFSSLDIVKSLGGNANQYSISIEFEGFYNQTKGKITAKQLESAVWLTKHIQKEVQRIYGYQIPFDRQHLVGHFEITPKTRPNCPGQQFPWVKLMENLSVKENDEKPYRVRKAANYAASQLGAFSNLDNAKALADKNSGYKVFDKKGKLVYTPKEIGVGSTVIITGDKYATGSNIPQWVKKATHKVSRISGVSALLGNPNGINSWVRLADLKLG